MIFFPIKNKKRFNILGEKKVFFFTGAGSACTFSTGLLWLKVIININVNNKYFIFVVCKKEI